MLKVILLKHNTILSKINDAKDRFWDVVLIDLLINNNDRNEDNWGNSFYGKTSDERTKDIMSSEEKLLSSAINGITAYEDYNI